MNNVFYSIGYEGASIEDFLATLLAQGIETLVDVRDVPLSRKKGFSKTALGAALKANDIRYIHLKGLGDPKAGREAARSGRMDEFRRIFSTHMETEAAQEDLKVAADIVQESVACFLCFERDPKHCHRSFVADRLTEMTDLKRNNIGVRHGLAEEFGQIPYPDEQSAA